MPLGRSALGYANSALPASSSEAKSHDLAARADPERERNTRRSASKKEAAGEGAATLRVAADTPGESDGAEDAWLRVTP
jgi:hypothetical protein